MISFENLEKLYWLIEKNIFVISRFRWMFDHYNSSRSCTARCTKTSWFLPKSKPSHPWFHWKYESFYLSFVFPPIHNMACIIRYITNFITAKWIRDPYFLQLSQKMATNCWFLCFYPFLLDVLFWNINFLSFFLH